jgi:hypothetical protein
MTATTDAPPADRDAAKTPGAAPKDAGPSEVGDNRDAVDTADSDDRTADEKKKDKARKQAEEREPGDLSGLVERLTNDEEKRARNAESQALVKAFESLAGRLAAPQIGSQNFFYGADATALTGPSRRGDLLAAAGLEQIRRRFVAPGGYADLYRGIQQNSVLIIRDHIGFGRSWAAAHLLDAVCDGRVRRMPGPRTGDWPGDEEIDDDTGYLWDHIPAERMQRVDANDIESFAQRLRSRYSRAVIITTSDWKPQPGLAQFVGTLTERPSASTIVERCLTHSLSDEHSDAVVQTLKDQRVLSALEGMIADACTTAEVADFARSLASTVTGTADLDDVCASADRSDERLATWFTELEADVRSFAVALAALPCASLPTVSMASRLIDERIQKAENPDETPRVQVFGRTIQNMLTATHARRERVPAQWPYGVVPSDIVRPTLVAYSKRLLTLLWNTYPQTHPILTGWLKELASSEDPEMRVPASTATGLLAELDFPHIYYEMLATWATSYTREDRHAAVAALRIPVLNPQLTEVVWTVLMAWSRPEASIQLQMTAAAALGAPVGATDYSRALDILGTQANTESYRLIQAVCQSVTDLFGAAYSGAATQVITTLTRWSEDGNVQRMNTAFAAFLQIALDLDWTRPNGEKWPALLCLADGDTQQRDAVGALWRLTLHRPKFDGAAVNALHRYVRAADVVPTMREPLADLLIAIARTIRDESTLRYHLAIWSKERTESTETADILIDRLKRTR